MLLSNMTLGSRVGTGSVQLWWAEYFFFGLVWLKRFGCLVAVWLTLGSTNEHTSPSGLEKLKQIGLKSGVKHTYLPFYTNLVVFKKIGDNIFNTMTSFFI